MSGLLAAAGRIETVVVEHGGTAWWVPVATALFVALVAAIASYYVTWRFKTADVNRESALRAADLVDEAEQIASWSERFDAEGGAAKIARLLQQARVRAEPLDDADLHHRFQAALSFTFEFQLWRLEPVGARHWLRETAANVREGLLPHLAAPRLVARKPETKRSFPKLDTFNAIERDPEGNALLEALDRWSTNETPTRLADDGG
jgi:hypothetical protein